MITQPLSPPAYMYAARQFVPLVLEVAAAELLVFLLFWVAGSFGPAAQERSWLFNIYNLLALIVLAKVSAAGRPVVASHMCMQGTPSLEHGYRHMSLRSAPRCIMLQCATDSYIYSFAPHMWQHYRWAAQLSRSQSWPVACLLASHRATLGHRLQLLTHLLMLQPQVALGRADSDCRQPAGELGASRHAAKLSDVRASGAGKYLCLCVLCCCCCSR